MVGLELTHSSSVTDRFENKHSGLLVYFCKCYFFKMGLYRGEFQCALSNLLHELLSYTI